MSAEDWLIAYGRVFSPHRPTALDRPDWIPRSPREIQDIMLAANCMMAPKLPPIPLVQMLVHKPGTLENPGERIVPTATTSNIWAILPSIPLDTNGQPVATLSSNDQTTQIVFQRRGNLQTTFRLEVPDFVRIFKPDGSPFSNLQSETTLSDPYTVLHFVSAPDSSASPPSTEPDLSIKVHYSFCQGIQVGYDLNPTTTKAEDKLLEVDILPAIELESKDRFLSGSVDISSDFWKDKSIQFVNTTSGEDLGSFNNIGAATPGIFIYESKEDFFEEEELDATVGGSVDPRALNQKVVFYRDQQDPKKLRFFTTFQSLGIVEARILTSSGTQLRKQTQELTEHQETSELIDFVVERIRTIDLPPVLGFEQPEDAIGTPDDPITVTVAIAGTTRTLTIAPRSGPSGGWTDWMRNLGSKVVHAWEESIRYSPGKLPLAAFKGFVDGAWDGIKSDVTGIVELGLLIGESATGNFTRAKQMYDGIKQLGSLDANGRSQLIHNLIGGFITGSQQALPWTFQAENPVDQVALVAYIEGYAIGFIAEQAAVVWIGAGVISKVGQFSKSVLLASKAGRLVLTGVEAIHKFRVNSLRYLQQFAPTQVVVREMRKMLDEISQINISGKSVAEHIENNLSRLNSSLINHKVIAEEIAKYAQGQWSKVGGGAYYRMAIVIAESGQQVTEASMKGFARFYRAMIDPNGIGDYTHYLIRVSRDSVPSGPVNQQSLMRIQEMFSDVGSGYRMSQLSPTEWMSPGGLIYGQGSAEGHRIMHVLAHTIPGYKPGTHSVFRGAKEDVFSLIDSAWSNRGPHTVNPRNGNWALFQVCNDSWRSFRKR